MGTATVIVTAAVQRLQHREALEMIAALGGCCKGWQQTPARSIKLSVCGTWVLLGHVRVAVLHIRPLKCSLVRSC